MARTSRFAGQSPARPESVSRAASMSIDMLAHNPRNRRTDDHDGAASDLLDTVKAHGVLQPLGIVKAGAFIEAWPEHADAIGDARWVVMAGNRRLAAAREAGLSTVPVHELQLTDAGEIDAVMLVENVHRKSLSPLAEAEALAELAERHGSQAAAARALGMTSAWVSQRLALRRLAPEVQSAVESGDVTVKDARQFNGMGHDEQRAALTRLMTPGEPESNGAGVNPVNGSGPDPAQPKRSRPVRLHCGAGAAVDKVATGVSELVAALHEQRRNGASDDDLQGVLDDLAQRLQVTVADLPPAVRGAAGIDKEHPREHERHGQ